MSPFDFQIVSSHMTAELSFDEFGIVHSDLKRNHAETIPATFMRSKKFLANELKCSYCRFGPRRSRSFA